MNKETFDSLHKHSIEHRYVQIPPREGGENRKKKLEGLKDKRCREDAKAQQLLRLIERRRIGYLAHLYNRVKPHLDSSRQKLEQEQLEWHANTNSLEEMKSVDADVVVSGTVKAVYDFLADTYLEENQNHDEEFEIILGVNNHIAISSDGITYQEKDYVPPHNDLWNGLSVSEVLLLRDKLKKIIELIDSCCIEEKKRDFYPSEIEWLNHENQEREGAHITPQDCNTIPVLLMESIYPELVDQPNLPKIQVFNRNNFSIADVLLAPAYFGLLHVDASRTDKARNDIFLKRCTWKSCSQVFQANNRNEKYCSSCKSVAKKERNDESRAESRLKKQNETYHDLAKELKRYRYLNGEPHHIDKISISLNCSTASLYQRFSSNKDDYWIRQNIRIQKHNKHEYSFHIEPRN